MYQFFVYLTNTRISKIWPDIFSHHQIILSFFVYQMYSKYYTELKYKNHIPIQIPNLNWKAKNEGPINCICIYIAQISKNHVYWIFRFNLELLWICCFFSKMKLRVLERKQYKAIVCIHWIFPNVAHIVTTTAINYILIGNCSLPLWILVCIVLSTIHGFIKDFYQMNYYWVMQNIRGATIHLIKIWHWILAHLLIVFSLCTVIYFYWVYEFYQ